jgi:mannosyltransferase OCH1-like enzyme
MIAIPKRLGHIWIGHRPAPSAWLDSWKAHHPDWDYRLYGNDYLFSRRWRHQALINEFYRRGEYAGVSDLMRYEILQEEGGFIPEADSTCLRPTDELWRTASLYAVWENEALKPGLISPFLASVPGHRYLEFVMLRIGRKNRPETLQKAWKAVGNQFLKKALRNRMPEDFVVFPSHYFIPTHKRSERYTGPGPVYCEQHWGSTFGLYEEPEGVEIRATRAEHMELLDARLGGAEAAPSE